MAAQRVLVIGLDGMTFDLLEPLRARESMPFLSSVWQDAYSGTLKSTTPPISATAWSTFITGTNPGQHGILQFVTLRPGQAARGEQLAQEIFPGGVSLLNASSIQGVKLWDLLAAAEKRQVVVNVPMTYPPPTLNGCMVTGMMTPPSAAVFTHPPTLSERLHEAGYEIDLSVSEKEFDFDPLRLVERLADLLRKRRDIALELMGQEPWDFYMIVFTGTDRLQHRFWKYLVPGYSDYDLDEGVRLRPGLFHYFEELDKAIAQLVAAAGPEATVLILSDHGFGPVSDRTVHRLALMEALGLSREDGQPGVVRLRSFLEGKLGLTPDRLRRIAKRFLPGRWLGQLEAQAREAQLAATAADLAYSVTLHEYVGGIYINRERLHLGEGNYEAIRREIVTKLTSLEDPSTGRLFVEKVYTREELYTGSAVDECPDVVFYLAPGYGLSGGVGPGGALVSQRRGDPEKQGTHRDDGLLLIRGPDVVASQSAENRLVDVTSTLLYLLDVPIPVTMDSRPILAAFDPEIVAERPPRYAEAPLQPAGAEAPGAEFWMSEEDEEELLGRLRGLGYVE